MNRSAGFRLSHIIKTRSFLLQLLITAIIAASVPLAIMTIRMVSDGMNHVYEMTDTRLKNATDAAAIQFESYVNRMDEVSYKMHVAPKLFDSALDDGVQAEKDALELMKNYETSLPYADCYALYSLSNDAIYTNQGKMRTNGFCAFVLGMSEEEFINLLDSFGTARGFATWEKSKGNVLYVMPLRTGTSAAVSRYVIFKSSPSHFSEIFSTVLSEEYEIHEIQDGKGNIIYKNVASEHKDQYSEQLLSMTIRGSGGFVLTVCTDKSSLQAGLEKLGGYSRLLCTICALLCGILIAGLVFVNYRPIAQLLKQVHKSDAERFASEFETILSSYYNLINEKGKLTYQLYEKDVVIVDRIMDELLSGRKISAKDMALLTLDSPWYWVVCAPLDQIKNVTEIIEHNGIGTPIYAIEMYRDNHLAFVCGAPEDSEESLMLLSKTLRQLVASDTVPLGYSRAFDNPTYLAQAYLEANQALHTAQNTDKSDFYRSDINQQPMFMLEQNDESIEKLANAVKTGDDYMIRYAEEFFEKLTQSDSSQALQRYQCYQLVDLYRSLLEASNHAIDMEKFSSVLHENSLSALRVKIPEMIEALQTEIRSGMENSAVSAEAALIQYIDKNFTNPLLDMNDAADHIGVSIYTASRILKKLTGVNFRSYINDLRLEYAQELLLNTDMSVNDISAQVGFTSPSYFISSFKKAFSMPPGSFRKSCKEE